MNRIFRTYKALKAIKQRVTPAPQGDDQWWLPLSTEEKDALFTFWATIEHKITVTSEGTGLEQLTDEELDKLQAWMRVSKDKGDYFR